MVHIRNLRKSGEKSAESGIDNNCLGKGVPGSMPKDKTLKTNSIYYRFLKLLALAFVTAALFSSFLNQGGEKLLDYYFTKTNYMERENARRYNDLRDYVKKKQIVHGRHGQAG